MRVLMLGWEFPPFITGGLGTACFGLTKAMDRRGLHVTFVVPKALHETDASHVKLLSPDASRDADNPLERPARYRPTDGAGPGETTRPDDHPFGGSETPGIGKSRLDDQTFKNVEFINVRAEFGNPYEASSQARLTVHRGAADAEIADERPDTESRSVNHGSYRGSGLSTADTNQIDGPAAQMPPVAATAGAAGDYDGDIISQVERYAHFVLEASGHLEFDIIHAHDWMTYPAGMMLARVIGRPLVVHIHSTEFDRSGEHVNQRIYDIERRGMNSALRVIAVSQLTKNMVIERYAVPDERVEVVYNGVDLEPAAVGMTGIRSKDKIVLYFGRITHQKGPEYFIRAAKRVLDVMDNVKFVVAGSGDMAKVMIEMAADMGIGHKVLFTGFLRGNDIKRVFNLADLYVMPSVSEPFGIAPLEAMSHNVPALISKSSGVSEVLTHALKVDFWDVDDMANKIVAVLRHPPLSQTLTEHGAFEVRRLTWDGAAQRCEQVYQAVLEEMVTRPT